MTRPLIQIDDYGNSREMTEQEHQGLIASGWTIEPQNAITLHTQNTTYNPYADETPGAS
jgi:hypothetical protein